MATRSKYLLLVLNMLPLRLVAGQDVHSRILSRLKFLEYLSDQTCLSGPWAGPWSSETECTLQLGPLCLQTCTVSVRSATFFRTWWERVWCDGGISELTNHEKQFNCYGSTSVCIRVRCRCTHHNGMRSSYMSRLSKISVWRKTGQQGWRFQKKYFQWFKCLNWWLA